MAGKKWGISGNTRVNNPVGVTTEAGGLAGLAAAIASMIDGDVNATNIAAAIGSIIVFLLGEFVRRQPPAE